MYTKAIKVVSVWLAIMEGKGKDVFVTPKLYLSSYAFPRMCQIIQKNYEKIQDKTNTKQYKTNV